MGTSAASEEARRFGKAVSLRKESVAVSEILYCREVGRSGEFFQQLNHVSKDPVEHVTLLWRAPASARAPASRQPAGVPERVSRSRAPQMMRATVLFSALAGASAGAVELKSGTFEAEVKNSGKNAFVKFLAPW